MRRLSGNVTREPSGQWIIAEDHLERAAVHETSLLRDRPVAVEILSSQPLSRLVAADAATWLDRSLVAAEPLALREAGFGSEVRGAQDRRRQWLIAQGLAEQAGTATAYRPDLLATLQRRELLRIAGQLSEELGLPFAQPSSGTRIEGVVRRRIDLVSGRFALIEKSREFTLVPWRPVLERQIGKPVSGIMRGDGVSWSFGRGRQGPVID
jgi:hypothetical protein